MKGTRQILKQSLFKGLGLLRSAHRIGSFSRVSDVISKIDGMFGTSHPFCTAIEYYQKKPTLKSLGKILFRLFILCFIFVHLGPVTAANHEARF